jgi:SAM-dependent methyltransferase
VAEHKYYTHVQEPYENASFEEQFDLIWCSHTLEHIPNVQHFLVTLQGWLKPGGWLFIAVPSDRQARIHVGHLTLWTPAHLAYNLVCAGWDCKDAIWYTDYLSIGMVVQNKGPLDLSWRTSLPNEVSHLNQFMPKHVRHNDGAWWGNNWPDEVPYERASDPPLVTIGVEKTNIPPQTQLAYGPNPELRRGYERIND